MNRIWNIPPFFYLFSIILFCNANFVFPQTNNSGKKVDPLEKVLGVIVWFFTSNYTKAFCFIFLGGLVIPLILNRGELGIIILRSIGGIIEIL